MNCLPKTSLEMSRIWSRARQLRRAAQEIYVHHRAEVRWSGNKMSIVMGIRARRSLEMLERWSPRNVHSWMVDANFKPPVYFPLMASLYFVRIFHLPDESSPRMEMSWGEKLSWVEWCRSLDMEVLPQSGKCDWVPSSLCRKHVTSHKSSRGNL